MRGAGPALAGSGLTAAPARPAGSGASAPGPVSLATADSAWRRLLARPLAVAALLVLLALPPRLLDTDRFITTDELFWIGRSAAFARAVTTGQLAQTFQSGHPGVTTMWTTWLGMGSQRAAELAPSRREVSRREVSQDPVFLPALAAARRAFGVVTGLGVGLVVLLAWRLFGPWPAALGGALLALDPFFLAHARLVHIDASLTLWMTLAVLAALYRGAGGGRWSLGLAGAATGLALLSKSPALLLLGLVPLALLLARATPGAPGGPDGARGRRSSRLRPDWRSTGRDLAGWALIAALTFVLLWPAVWSAPGETLARLTAFVRDNANPDHAAAADAEGAGPLFYPLVLLFRTTPLTWLGLLALAVVPARLGGPARASGRAVLVLLLFVVGFGAAMTVAAKNFDRYLLPVFPALDLLAGLGLWRLVGVVADSWALAGHGPAALDPARRRAVGGAVALGAIVLLSGWWVVGSWPYLLTYANPLLGGNPAAHRSIASAWGEGLDQAAAYLNARPVGDRARVAMPGEIYTTVLDAQLDGTVAPAEGADAGAYDALVVYRRNRDLGERPPYFDDELLAWEPDRTVVLNGVEYAWVYQTNAGAPVRAVFGDTLALDGYGLDTTQPRVGRRLELRLRWRPLQPLPAGLGVVVELRPLAGRVRRLTLPLQAAGDPSAWPLAERVSVAYQLPLDPDLAPGAYTVAVRVVGADGETLPVTTQPARPVGVAAEPDAVPLRRVLLR